MPVPNRSQQDRKGVRGSHEGKPGDRRADEAHRHQGGSRQADGSGQDRRSGQAGDQSHRATATPETDGDASAKAPAKRATKAAAKAKPNGVAPRTRAKKGAPAEDGATTDTVVIGDDDPNTGIEDLESEPADLEDDADLVVEVDLDDLEEDADGDGHRDRRGRAGCGDRRHRRDGPRRR